MRDVKPATTKAKNMRRNVGDLSRNMASTGKPSSKTGSA
jgi:hypothetical protein